MDTAASPARDLEQRTFAFALRIVRLRKKLCATPPVGRILGQQTSRSGTSVGANVEEAQAASSGADFVNKNRIALKEARETRYRLRLNAEARLVSPELLSNLLAEADEIAKITWSDCLQGTTKA